MADHPESPLFMDIQEHLTAFDGWLTRRIEEAYDASKDLAFRDLTPERPCEDGWEYRLLDPGCRTPEGEGWSVYRLQGVWPEFLAAAEGERAGPSGSVCGASFDEG
jgi:hypothetical protein